MSWVWVAWLAVILLSFAILEGYALRSSKTTLSRFVWNTSRAWPPLPFFVGLIVGFLACHFWWIGPGCDLIQ